MSLFGELRSKRPDEKKIVEIIKNEKIDLNDCWEDSSGFSPLMVAIQNKQVQIVSKLLEFGANVNLISTQSGGNALIKAATYGDMSVIALLLRAGARINHVDQMGRTALMYACANGNVAAALTLFKLDTGAVCNITSNEGDTALNLAKEEGHIELIAVLFKAQLESSHTNATTTETAFAHTEETWLAPIFEEHGTPDDMVQLCEEKLVHQEGFSCPATLAIASTNQFNRAYLDGLGITQLGLQVVLLDYHAKLQREQGSKKRDRSTAMSHSSEDEED